MKKIFYFLIPSIIIATIIYSFLSCSPAGSSGGGGSSGDTTPNLNNILGGWVFCNDSFNPSQSTTYAPEYAMMDIKTDTTDFGYIDNPIGGDFWTYYDPAKTIAGAITSSSASGDWVYQYTSPGGHTYKYSVSSNYIRASVTSQPYKYYQYRFDFQNPVTNTKIYYGYSSDGTYKEVTSSPLYFKKIDTYTNNGNDGVEIR